MKTLIIAKTKSGATEGGVFKAIKTPDGWASYDPEVNRYWAGDSDREGIDNGVWVDAELVDLSPIKGCEL